jgi:hypothetical protein
MGDNFRDTRVSGGGKVETKVINKKIVSEYTIQ